MLPPAIVRRSGTPAPRAAATSNASARHLASCSACVSGGGSSTPSVRPMPMLSLTVRRTESKRTGWELRRVNPTVAAATGAPSGIAARRTWRLAVSETAGGIVAAGASTAAAKDALSGGGAIIPCRAGDVDTDGTPRRADGRAARRVGTTAGGGTGEVTYTRCSDARLASSAACNANGPTNPDPDAATTSSAIPTVTPIAATRLARCSARVTRGAVFTWKGLPPGPERRNRPFAGRSTARLGEGWQAQRITR